MEVEQILRIIAIILGIVSSTIIPAGIALYKAIKARKAAETEAEKAKAESAIQTEIKKLVQGAETAYKTINEVLKMQGGSAGSMKKSDVMKSLKAFCFENGYEWNEAAMDKAVEDEVAYTKSVNGIN